VVFGCYTFHSEYRSEDIVRLERIFALILVITCLITAVGNWLDQSPPQRARDNVAAPSSSGRADIALLEVYGPIADNLAGGPLSNSSGTNANDLIRKIQRAREDNVKAILLAINSPGGTAAASQAIYDELMRVRNETKIKIVASLGDVAASGGYFVASAAHHIVANPASITGSIGVIIRTQNLSSLLGKLGVESGTIQSGEYKDILSPFRDTKPAEEAILQGVVQDSYQQFLNSIVAGRNISLEQLKPLADGRIFTGSQALAANLVDSLGNYHKAVDKTAELANIKGEPRLRNYTSGNVWESFFPRLESLLPGYQQIQQARWYKIPLTLMQ